MMALRKRIAQQGACYIYTLHVVAQKVPSHVPGGQLVSPPTLQVCSYSHGTPTSTSILTFSPWI